MFGRGRWDDSSFDGCFVWYFVLSFGLMFIGALGLLLYGLFWHHEIYIPALIVLTIFALAILGNYLKGR